MLWKGESLVFGSELVGEFPVLARAYHGDYDEDDADEDKGDAEHLP